MYSPAPEVKGAELSLPPSPRGSSASTRDQDVCLRPPETRMSVFWAQTETLLKSNFLKDDLRGSSRGEGSLYPLFHATVGFSEWKPCRYGGMPLTSVSLHSINKYKIELSRKLEIPNSYSEKTMYPLNILDA